MGKVRGGMTVSLDGFVNDRNGDVGRLYPDLAALGQTEMLQEEIRTVGAVVMGRRAFAMGDPDEFADHYEFQVPIFVLTHHAPAKHPKENDRLTVTFVTDGIAGAIAQAQAAAGAKAVQVVGGASTIRQCLQAGLLDELQLGFVPVLLGSGLRLFDQPDLEQIHLEQTRVLEAPGRTDVLYRVVKTAPARDQGEDRT
jgi:dihydrofolate reductase